MQQLTQTISELIQANEYDKAAETFLTQTGSKLTVKYLKYDYHFPGDKDKRDIYQVTLSRKIAGKVRKMSFNFGQSLNDTGKYGLHYTGNMSLLKPEFKAILTKAGFNENGYNVKNTTNPARIAAILETVRGEYSRIMCEMYLNRLIADFEAQVEKDKKDTWSNEALKNRVFFHKLPKDKQDAIKANLKETATSYTKAELKKIMARFTELNNAQSAPRPYDILTCLTTYDPETFSDFCACYGYDEDSRTAERTYKAVVKEYNSLTRLYGPDELEAMAEIQ